MLIFIYAKIKYYIAKIKQKQITNLEMCRYIFNKNEFNTTKVKPSAFLDSRKPKELSIYQNILSKNEMVNIGNIYVGRYHKKPKNVKALAIIHSQNIEKHKINDNNLRIISFPYPHKLHCNIVDYDFDQIKDRNIAHQMAEDSILEII